MKNPEIEKVYNVTYLVTVQWGRGVAVSNDYFSYKNSKCQLVLY